MVQGEFINSKGTILYIGGFELPDKNAAAHRVLSNAKIFRELGMKVAFVGIDKNIDQSTDVLMTKKDIQGFESYSIPYPKSKQQWISYLSDINKYIKVGEAMGDIETIVFYNFQSVAMFKLMRYCHQHAIRCIADVTEWYSVKGQGLAYAILKGTDTWFRMRVLHKQMDGLIVISRYLENYYKRHANVVYLPPLVDLNEEKWGKVQESESEDGHVKLVYAGSPGQKDRIDILIDALRMTTRSYQLDVIGVTLQEYLEMYSRHNKFLRNKESIMFHGRMHHIETLNYIKRANFSCFFREDDRVSKAGFPTKFVEAVSCGIVILTNSTSDVIEYCDGKNCILVKKDARMIARTLENFDAKSPFDIKIFDYSSWIDNVNEFFSRY